MTYSANDHPVDTLGLVMEVLDEAREQTSGDDFEREIIDLQDSVQEARNKAVAVYGPSPTQKLIKELEDR